MPRVWQFVLLLTCVWVSPLWGQPGDEPDMQLSPKQSRTLRTIRNRFEGRRQDLQMRLDGRKLELAQMLRQDGTEKESVKAKLDEIFELEKQRQLLIVDQIFECKSQLSPAQWGSYRRRVLGHLLERRRGSQFPRRESDPSSL